jgi:hypothetical protein
MLDPLPLPERPEPLDDVLVPPGWPLVEPRAAVPPGEPPAAPVGEVDPLFELLPLALAAAAEVPGRPLVVPRWPDVAPPGAP